MDRIDRQRARLDQLISEAGGTQDQLAEKIGTATSYISQLKTARNGIARKFCVRLEQGMGKPDGWMDQWLPEELDIELLTGHPLSPTEKRVLNMWRSWTPAVKKYVFNQMQIAFFSPDIVASNAVTESELEDLIIDTVTETGEFRTLPDTQS